MIENQRGRIFAGLAAALAYHGYEDTKIADIIELAGLSRATFYEHFSSKDACFTGAYDDGVERLVVAVEAAVGGGGVWTSRLSAGLRTGLEFLAADPQLTQLLFVEALAAARPARLEYERSLLRLAEALGPAGAGPAQGDVLPEETTRLLAGGLASHISGRVLAGEAEGLPEDHDLLLGYLLAPLRTAAMGAVERRAAAQA